MAIFEAVHGSAPDIAGQNIANPAAQILASVMMLDYLGEHEAAKKIEISVASVLAEGKKVTRDINNLNYVGTSEFADAVIEKIEK